MRKGLLATATVGAAYGLATYLGTTWGSRREERRGYLPSDGLVPHPMIVTNHAITIRGRSEDVWPWLVQMGWHRAGWYTYRWIDRLLFPANLPSANSILPEYQNLKLGDHVPDGAPETGVHFVVEMLEPHKLLVLRSESHLPPWPKNGRLNWAWAYSLGDEDDHHARLLLRTRGSLSPPWLALVYRALLWTDFVMGRSHLRGIKRRVEGAPRTVVRKPRPSREKLTAIGLPVFLHTALVTTSPLLRPWDEGLSREVV